MLNEYKYKDNLEDYIYYNFLINKNLDYKERGSLLYFLNNIQKSVFNNSNNYYILKKIDVIKQIIIQFEKNEIERINFYIKATDLKEKIINILKKSKYYNKSIKTKNYTIK